MFFVSGRTALEFARKSEALPSAAKGVLRPVVMADANQGGEGTAAKKFTRLAVLRTAPRN